jgi:type IV pilus assembly protein PilX
MDKTNKIMLTKPPEQAGAALLMSLIILLVMTVLGISAMSNTILETKMAHNTQQRQIAYQAAETALREAEQWIATNITTTSDITTHFTGEDASSETAYYNSQKTKKPQDWAHDTSQWTSTNSIAVDKLDTDVEDPKFIIEYMGRVGRPPPELPAASIPDMRAHAFRITALGYGADPSARYILTSTVTKRMNSTF